MGLPKIESLPQRFENENAYINEMYLIKGFGRASPGFDSDPLIGSGRARGSLQYQYKGKKVKLFKTKKGNLNIL